MEALDGAAPADLPAGALAQPREQSAAGEEGRRLIMEVRELRVAFGEAEILKGVDVSWDRGSVGALIGPSGCGKTTLLRALNRLAELAGARIDGRILLDGVDVREQPAHEVRRRVGMVFQRPNPFPMSIFDNIAYALRDQARRRPRRPALAERVEQVLRQAQLWEEVKDDLGRSALRMSGGQQQRLCIARTLAAGPDIVLMDEPCASLDPHSTARVEELIAHLRGTVTQIVVTHNLGQARRISDRAAFLLMGELVEQGPSDRVLTAPTRPETRDFLEGVYG